ncbi:30S ribosomal protein S8 [Patescibacteria group bacterium]|nr:30S ribosomal protein S8 [Patescibacteria group bacterium]MBU1472291.1 30S ribosomal protein S8 [Patescibacteria group bacterium]MBU2460458.1 30S ribosomal protein S8 [Patescibacteria group bacterium]MBU2543993.1 30S ribosomal protein S8 [Patescibacteria group bacterium]
MMHDSIGDMIIQIKNAACAGKEIVELPHSNMKAAVARIFQQEQYLDSVEKIGSKPKELLRLKLSYEGKVPVLTNVKRVSKPGLRCYVTKYKIPTVMGGTGISIVSTPQGIMTGKEAWKRGIGGELLCTVW